MAKLKKVISEGLNATKPRPAARMTDTIGHGPPSGAIMFGAPTVIIGGQIAARMGDPIECKIHGPGGNIQLGSLRVLIAGACAARMGDPTMCCAPGKAGTGAPGTVGAPGSFSTSEDSGSVGKDGPHDYLWGKYSTYNGEDGMGAKGQGSLRHSEGKGTLFGKQAEWSIDEGHVQGGAHIDKGGMGGSGRFTSFNAKGQIKNEDGSSSTTSAKFGTAVAEYEGLSGDDGKRKGFYQGVDVKASILSVETETESAEYAIPFTDLTIKRSELMGKSVGSVGATAGAGAWRDASDDRIHVKGVVGISALIGIKFGGGISIGKASSPGAGAVGLAGAITSGCMTVLIGG